MAAKKLTGIRVNEKHLEALAELAAKDGETVSFLIQQAIREYLERRQQAQKDKEAR